MMEQWKGTPSIVKGPPSAAKGTPMIDKRTTGHPMLRGYLCKSTKLSAISAKQPTAIRPESLNHKTVYANLAKASNWRQKPWVAWCHMASYGKSSGPSLSSVLSFGNHLCYTNTLEVNSNNSSSSTTTSESCARQYKLNCCERLTSILEMSCT